MKMFILFWGIAVAALGADTPKVLTVPMSKLNKDRPKQMLIHIGFGGKAFVTPDNLEAKARAYAHERKLQFDFANATSDLTISTDNSKEPVTIWFLLPEEKIAFIAYFGQDGKVARHKLGRYDAHY